MSAVGIAGVVTEQSQESVDAALARVSSIDLSRINAKLEGSLGREQVETVCDIYRKWLALHMCYPNAKLTPSKPLDEYWHTHILDTRAYTDDCEKLFGSYLHHYPYFGLEGDADDKDAGFELTKALYKKHFDLELVGVANKCSSTDCR